MSEPLPRRHTPRVEEIQSCVSSWFGIPVYEMLSDSREAERVLPRHVAMYLTRHLTPLSLPAIGRAFNRDHTTVIHALRCIDRRIADEEIRVSVKHCSGLLALKVADRIAPGVEW